jgi:hypothetical protein
LAKCMPAVSILSVCLSVWAMHLHRRDVVGARACTPKPGSGACPWL